MREVPEGWAAATFDEIGSWIGGGTPSKANSTYWGGPIPWISPKDMKEPTIRSTIDTITKHAVEESATKLVPAGSVVIVTRSGILARTLPIAITAIDATLNQDLKALILPDGICPDFVAWAMRAQERQILETCRKGGTTVHSIEMPQLANFILPIAPTNEQRRIVERIETLFAEIDAGVASLRAAGRALGLYRRSLLKAAFEGRLTEEWRAANADKLETPDALLARIRREREARYAAAMKEWEAACAAWEEGGREGRRPGRPKKLAPLVFKDGFSEPWAIVRVKTLLTEPLCNGRSVKDKANGFPVLRLSALKNGKIDLLERKAGDWSEKEAEPFLIHKGDMFAARGNGSKHLVGMGGIVSGVQIPVAFPDTMIRLRLDGSAVDPHFFLFVWNSKVVRNQIERSARTTAGIYKVNQDHIGGFTVPLPSLKEQAEIVRILDARLSASDALAEDIETGLKRAGALRQSILAQAFRGGLVPQDPDDEPAARLLARIRAERGARPKARRARKALQSKVETA